MAKSKTDRWLPILDFQGDLSPDAAHALLNFGFSPRDQALMNELSAKAQAGTLSREEQVNLDTFERLGSLLDILHSKARQSLAKKPKRVS
jgi:hypothetical protein